MTQTATVAQLLPQTLLTNTLTTTLFSCSAKTIINEIVLCNTDSSARNVTLFFGNGHSTVNTILAAFPVAAGDTVILSLSTVLLATDVVYGGASTASVVTINISGVTVA